MADALSLVRVVVVVVVVVVAVVDLIFEVSGAFLSFVALSNKVFCASFNFVIISRGFCASLKNTSKICKHFFVLY